MEGALNIGISLWGRLKRPHDNHHLKNNKKSDKFLENAKSSTIFNALNWKTIEVNTLISLELKVCHLSKNAQNAQMWSF